MSELDGVIRHVLDNDPTLASEARELLSFMMREARLVMQHGTPAAKAALISRGLGSILSHAATATQTDQFAEMRADLERIRHAVFADVPRVTPAPAAPAPSPALSPRPAMTDPKGHR